MEVVVAPHDVEKGPRLCSRIAQNLNVPQGYASASRSLRPRWMAFLNILQGTLNLIRVKSMMFSLEGSQLCSHFSQGLNVPPYG